MILPPSKLFPLYRTTLLMSSITFYHAGNTPDYITTISFHFFFASFFAKGKKGRLGEASKPEREEHRKQVTRIDFHWFHFTATSGQYCIKGSLAVVNCIHNSNTVKNTQHYHYLSLFWPLWETKVTFEPMIQNEQYKRQKSRFHNILLTINKIINTAAADILYVDITKGRGSVLVLSLEHDAELLKC